MRYVDGDDLRSLVRRGGALDPAEAARARRPGRRGAGRDPPRRASSTATSSPRTCWSTPSGHVYLTDFGLAKAGAHRAAAATRTGQWVGTLDYVAPEQIRGGRIDARADVYALGGVLHYALTGQVPFEREGDEAKLWAQLSAPPPVPSALRRGLRARVRRRRGARDGQGRRTSATRRRATSAAPRAPRRSGASPTEPERMVARGAAAPDAAPTEPGLAAEASTRTAPRRAAARGAATAGVAARSPAGRAAAARRSRCGRRWRCAASRRDRAARRAATSRAPTGDADRDRRPPTRVAPTPTADRDAAATPSRRS